MFEQIIRRAIRPLNSPQQLILGLVVGLLLTIASIWLSPIIVFGSVIGALFFYVMLIRPEISLLGIIIATSSIVFEEKLPLISFGGISLHLSDCLLLGMMGIIAGRWLLNPKFKIVSSPLNWPLIVFFSVTLCATIIALLQSSVSAETARRGIRTLCYYLIFFVVVNLVRDRRQITFLINGLLSIATIVAAAMLVQFILGGSIRLFAGYVESLRTQYRTYDDITRIVPPGFSIVLISFIAIFCIIVLGNTKKRRWLKVFQWGLLGIAIIVTFLRSYWAVIIFVFMLTGFIVKKPARQRLYRLSIMVLLSAGILLAVGYSNSGSRAARLISATMNRLSTLGSSGTFLGQDSSLNWRKIENKYAIKNIASNPILGTGIGFRYRPWDPRLDVRGPGDAIVSDYRGLIHNGHLMIMLQSGILGYVSFLWLSICFLFRGFRKYQIIIDTKMRGVVLGFSLAYLAILIAALVNSTFMLWSWTPVIGIMMGINEVIIMKYAKKRLPHE